MNYWKKSFFYVRDSLGDTILGNKKVSRICTWHLKWKNSMVRRANHNLKRQTKLTSLGILAFTNKVNSSLSSKKKVIYWFIDFTKKWNIIKKIKWVLRLFETLESDFIINNKESNIFISSNRIES